jgi:hypothetical protein
MSEEHAKPAELLAHLFGRLPTDKASDIQQHIKACPSCAAMLRCLEATREILPAEDAGAGKAAACWQSSLTPEPAGEAGGLPAGTARLLFDSGFRPATGLRGTTRLDRRLVFAEGEVLLDVHIEPAYECGRQSLTGQVRSAHPDAKRLNDVPVLLLERQRVLAATRTNKNGEFVFDDVPYEDMWVWVLCPRGPMKALCLLTA